MFAVCVGLSVAVGVVIAESKTKDQILNLGGTLVTVAEVLGGAAGILFAVIVFGIQFHGEKLDKAAFLVRYLRRREGLIPIAAFTLAVVAANVVVSLLCSLGLPNAAVPMAILDLPLVMLVLWLVLWLLYRMAVSVSEDLVTLLTPSLTWEYDRALDEDIHHRTQVKVFEEALAAVRMKYSTVGGFTSLERVTPVKLNLTGRGSVTDVNLSALKVLAEHIQSTCPNYDAKLCVGPGDSVDNTLALILSATRDDQDRQKQDVVAPSEEVVGKLQRKLRAVYRLGASPVRDVVGVLSRFEQALVSYARRGLAEQLEQGLEIQVTLVERGLSRPDAVPGSFSIHRECLPDFLAGFSYSEMAMATIASGDQEKVSALLMFARRMMITALENKHPGLYYRAGQIIEAVYFHAIQGTTLTDYVGETIDVALSTIGAQFEYSHSLWRLDPPRIAEQMPGLVVDLGWRLRLIKIAIEAGRTNDASNFQDRLFKWDEHSGKRHAGPHEKADVPPELREACDLMSYATVITAAWCLHLVERNDKHADTARAVFQRCASDLGAREHLILVWEGVRGGNYDDADIDKRLGISHWTMPSPGRVGDCVVGGGGDAWIERGFFALLLIRPSATKYEKPAALDIPPRFRPKTPEVAKTLINAIMGNEAVRTGMLSIADDKRNGAVDAVVALFAERLTLFKRSELQRIVAAPVDDARHKVLAEETLARLGRNRGIVPGLEQLGAATAKALPSSSAIAEYAMRDSKEYFISTADGGTQFGEFLADGLREQESIQIASAAERQSEPLGTCDDLRGLANDLRSACRELTTRGFTPSMIFVPKPMRFVIAISGTPAWRLPKNRTLGDCHLGEWESRHLYRWPYVNPSSIVVLDVRRFYGSTDVEFETDFELLIEEPDKQQHEQWLTDAAKEADPSKIRDAHEVCVVWRVRLPAALGVCDPKAAIRIDLDLTKLGYALVSDERFYHHPDCDLLQGKNDVTHSLAKRLPKDRANRSPCERCRPDDWKEHGECLMHDAPTVG